MEIERTCLNLTNKSVLIGFSHHGETSEVLMAIRRSRESGAFTVLVTNNITVKQEATADIHLLTQVPAANIAGAYFALPRIAQLSLVELILSKIALFLTKKRMETKEEYDGEKEVTMR